MLTDFINASQDIGQQTELLVQCRIVVLGGNTDTRHPLSMQDQTALRNPGADVGVFDIAVRTFLSVEEMDGARMQAGVQNLEAAVRFAGQRQLVSGA
ncbi:hypothetical protein [Paraburkholderia phosphatilytica]|uniref:hypothetical protein n=1 Tax=Paraburkholderia phosphatilytica TaxID=2282883 RepID=UPI001F0BBE24|nr:hypothetical protein [Paraburkholderia phosphatilytica]